MKYDILKPHYFLVKYFKLVKAKDLNCRECFKNTVLLTLVLRAICNLKTLEEF